MSRRHPAMDWREYQNALFKKIPFVGNRLSGPGIENFVLNAVKQMLPEALSQYNPFDLFKESPAASLDYEIFESHRSVFVRCRFSDRNAPPDLRFFASKKSLKIKFAGKTEVIALPKEIQPSRAIGRIRDGILEIRMPKSRQPNPYREIYIHG